MFMICSMFDASAAAETEPLGAAQARAARRVAVLDELTALGLELARAITEAAVARARAGASAAENASASLALSRIAKTVRLNLALEDRLGQAKDGKSEGGETLDAAAVAAQSIAERARVLQKLWDIAYRDSLGAA